MVDFEKRKVPNTEIPYLLNFYERILDYRLNEKLNPDKTFLIPLFSGLTKVDCTLIICC